MPPGAVAESAAPVQLAELAVNGCPAGQRHVALNTLGAALFRAGRFEDSLRRLGEAIEDRGGRSISDDWSFLAMAHARLGHHAEALGWLDHFRGYRPSQEPDQFWYELEIRLLRREAEALILDPAFPADPFSPVH